MARHPFANSETHLGKIAHLLSDTDPRPAREQIASNQVGGWQPVKGFEIRGDTLVYPGKAVFPLLYESTLHDETIRIYDRAWVAVIQKDGSFEVSPLD